MIIQNIEKKLQEIAKIIYNKEFKEPGITGGKAGVIIFLYQYSKYSNNPKYSEKAYLLIEQIFEQIENGYSFHTFSNGLAGIGWMVEFLEQNDFLDCNTDEIIGDLDNFLYSIMLEELEKGNYDYLHGASGIALYFLKRKQSEKINTFLKEFVKKLEEISIKDDISQKWYFFLWNEKKLDENIFNLGLSHGIASIISILTKLYSTGNFPETVEILNKSINFLLSAKQDFNVIGSFFPNIVQKIDNELVKSRLAWCYGDLGIAVSLYYAAKSLNNKELEKSVIEILILNSKRRELIENLVIDAGLCHGTAGIAHIYKRMYRNTGIKEFEESANYWFEETLKMANHENSISGFKAFRTEEYGGWQEVFGFLEGLAGIGLSLMSAISDENPAWDEILLLS